MQPASGRVLQSLLEYETPHLTHLAWIAIVLAGIYITRYIVQKLSDGDINKGVTASDLLLSPPFVRGLPFIGSGPELFGSPTDFLTKAMKEHGDTFYIRVFGAKWLILSDRRDIEAVMALPEKKGSLVKAFMDIAGPTLPQDNGKSYPNEEIRKKLHASVSASPLIAHAVRPGKIKAWTPIVRKMVQTSLTELSSDERDDGNQTGTMVDIFEWCKNLIVAVTVRVLLGEEAAKDEAFFKKWCDLFVEADPERGFSSPYKAFFTGIQVMLMGERKIYRTIRELAFPLIDAEIESVIAGKPQDESASVVSSFVRSRYTKLGNDANELKLARLRIANDLFMFTLAAFSNSYASAAWCLWHIINDTNGIGQRIRSEMKLLDERHVGSLSALDYPELERCILEVGRLYTPATVPRKVQNSSFTVPTSGHIVPPGETLAISAFFAMRNPDAFPNPLSFDPSRYGPDRDERTTAGCLFMPFGAGAHKCPGRNFANMEIAIFVMEALRGMDWSLLKNNHDSIDSEKDEFTSQCINIPNHPQLNKHQSAFIHRPLKPIFVQYKRQQS